MDNRLIYQLQPILAKLHAPISLLDEDGNCLIPNNDIRFTLPPLPAQGEAVTHDGRMYMICSTVPRSFRDAAGSWNTIWILRITSRSSDRGIFPEIRTLL